MMKMMMKMMILQTPHKFSIDFLQAGDDTMCINEAYARGTAAGLPQAQVLLEPPSAYHAQGLARNKSPEILETS